MTAQVMVGNMWYLLMDAAVPKEEFFGGYSIRPLAVFLAPLGAALGKLWTNLDLDNKNIFILYKGNYYFVDVFIIVSYCENNACKPRFEIRPLGSYMNQLPKK